MPFNTIKIIKDWSCWIALTIFFICLAIGLWLSLKKPLWNDEIYTQIHSVEQPTFGGILTMKFVEGQMAPLFYLLQKFICMITGYKFPFPWDMEWTISDPASQIILRISSNFFMSLALALLFYFFTRYYSKWAGTYALLLALSSPMIWAYWAEARPYSIWVFLTTCQLLLILRILQSPSIPKKEWTALMAVHWLLALTAMLSLTQILIVSFVLWMAGERDWKRYWLLTFLPVGLCFFYYLHSPLLGSYRLESPWRLIFINIPPERILLPTIVFILTLWAERQKYISGLRNKDHGAFKVKKFFLLTGLWFATSLILLMIFKLRSTNAVTTFSERYFINLVPVGIVSMTIFSFYLFQMFLQKQWVQVNIVICLVGLLVLRFLKTAVTLYHLNLF